MPESFAPTVYLLCFLTSLVCAVMLGRSFHKTRAGLLFWSAACFALLAANNLLLVLDLIVFPSLHMALIRTLLALAAVSTLLIGFVWTSDEE